VPWRYSFRSLGYFIDSLWYNICTLLLKSV